MKKLYKKGKIHPSPPHHFSDQLAFLPATILTLTVALLPEDREVLAYLICFSGNLSSFTGSREKSYGGGGGGSGFNDGEHSTSFNCDCFRCYTSFWFRWDCSPNRQLIHEIIDAYENDNQVLATDEKKKMKQSKKDRKKKESSDTNTAASANNNSIINDNEVVVLEMKQCEQVSEEIFDSPGSFEIINGVGDISENDDDDNNVVIEEVKQQDLEKGSMRKLISFVGGKIWGVLGLI